LLKAADKEDVYLAVSELFSLRDIKTELLGVYAVWDNTVVTWQVPTNVFQCRFGNSNFAMQPMHPPYKDRFA
jgi:hypothetical protein